MLDHLKIVIKDLDEVSRIWSNPKLIFYSHQEKLNHIDWETIKTREKKFYRGILFCKFDYKLEVLFSPHYYKNNDVHNADDFTATECINTLWSIVHLFEITDFEKWQVINIEFGLNLVVPKYGKDLIVYAEYWKKTPFYNDTELAFSKKSYAVKSNGTANTYKIIKMYCKHSQFPHHCENETIRIEIKSKQSRYIERIAIKHLGHLIDQKPYQLMKDELHQLSKDLLFLDYKTTFSNLKTRELNKLKDYLHPRTWYLVLQKSRNEFHKKKQRYFKLLDKTGYNIHEEIRNSIAQKLNYLCDCSSEKDANSTAFIKTQKDANSSINILRIRTLLDSHNIYCKITGCKLHEKDLGAPYMRTSTLKDLQKEKPKEFERIQAKLISKRNYRVPKFEKSTIAHLAKQIRNRYYNSKRRKKKPEIVSINEIETKQHKLSSAFRMDPLKIIS